MHYPETKGCLNGKVCIKLKQPYRDVFNKNGFNVLEKQKVIFKHIMLVTVSRKYNHY